MRSVLIVLMWTRNVYYILEQPENSRFLKTPNMQHAVEITGGYLSPLTYQKAFGHDMPKPTRFTTNWPPAVLDTLIRNQPLELTRRLRDPANRDNYRIAIKTTIIIQRKNTAGRAMVGLRVGRSSAHQSTTPQSFAKPLPGE